MFYALVVMWLVASSDGDFEPQFRIKGMPSEEACWAFVAALSAHEVPDYATLTCVPLRHPNGT